MEKTNKAKYELTPKSTPKCELCPTNTMLFFPHTEVIGKIHSHTYKLQAFYCEMCHSLFTEVIVTTAEGETFAMLAGDEPKIKLEPFKFPPYKSK
jgi:hypothetical protein